MDVWNFLSVGVSTLVLLVVIHLAVFYVVKTLYPPRAPMQQPQVQFQPEPTVIQPPPPVAPEIPLVTTKLPPPVDTRDPGPSRPTAPTFSEAPKENEVKQSVNVPTYESLLSSVTASKEGQPNLGPMSGPTN
jgi:hypothetical protein